jgi:hydrogenase maturation protease
MTDRITILGVGNILLQDEGFGVRVVEELTRRYTFPDQVAVLDGGTLGMELTRFLMGTDKLIIIDAIAGNGPPGSVYAIEHDQVQAYFREKVSMHELGIQDVLAVLEVLEKPIQEVVVLGVQPATVDVGLELTPIAAGAVGDVINKVMVRLAAWQVAVVLTDGSAKIG